MKKFCFFCVILLHALLGHGMAANAAETLFPFPVAPDTCTSMESRCNYCVQRWWDKFEASKPLTQADDSLLYEAMDAYLNLLPHANLNLGQASIRNLMFKLQTNQSNYERVMSLVEVMLYLYPKQVFIDDYYLTFAQCAASASWIDKKLKSYYQERIGTINASKLGGEIMNFDVSDANGKKTRLLDLPTDTAQVVLLLFTADDANSPLERTRLSADLGVNALIRQGFAKVINVYVGQESKKFWASASQYPDWTLVSAPGLNKRIDVRFCPSVMVLDPASHTVQRKNMTVEQVKHIFNNY